MQLSGKVVSTETILFFDLFWVTWFLLSFIEGHKVPVIKMWPFRWP